MHGRARGKGELSHLHLGQIEGKMNSHYLVNPKLAETLHRAELGFISRRNSDEWGGVLSSWFSKLFNSESLI